MESESRSKRSPRRILQGVGIGVAVAVFVTLLAIWLSPYTWTTDAYTHGNTVEVTPFHQGIITAVLRDDTFLVHQGETLVQLDPTDYRIALERSEDALANQVRDVCALFQEVFQAQAAVHARRAELTYAREDFGYKASVVRAGAVSVDAYQEALSRFRASFFRMREAEATLSRNLAAVEQTAIATHPLVLEAATHLREAWVALYRCQLRAPVTGLVAQRIAQVGMQVEPGRTLMSVIPLDQIWVNANFKETQMGPMRIGQKVYVWSDYYGWRVPFDGEIVGLPGGSGITFSLLPPQNLSGNWIYIVQRLPVRVRLDPQQIERYPLRLGLSMTACVDLSDQSGPRVPTSGEDSPQYTTDILEDEELGAEEMVHSIVLANLDPQLDRYLYDPLYLSFEPMATTEEELLEPLLP